MIVSNLGSRLSDGDGVRVLLSTEDREKEGREPSETSSMTSSMNCPRSNLKQEKKQPRG